MGAAILTAALLTLVGNTRLDAGLRTEARAGVLRDPDSEAPHTGAALQLTPSVLLEAEEGPLALRGVYALNLGLQGSLGGFGTYSSHSVNASFTGGRADASIQAFGNVSAFFGSVDFTDAAQKLQQPFGLGDVDGIIPILFTGANVGALSRPTRRLRLRVGSAVQLVAVPEPVEDTRDLTAARPPPTALVPVDTLAPRPFAQRLPEGVPVTPPPDVLVPQLLPELITSAQYEATRRDSIELESRFATALKLDGPTYAAVTPSFRYGRRLTPRWNSDARAGVLLGWHAGDTEDLDGSGAIWPLFDLGVSGETRPLPTGVVRWSTRFGLLPFYDPFIGALTQRLIVGASAGWQTAHDVALDLGAQSYSLVGLLGTEEHARRVRDDHILALSGRASWFFLDNLKLEGGVVGSLRAKNPVFPVARNVNPELLAFVALSGGFPVVEEKERRGR